MLERFIEFAGTEAPAEGETPATTRERLKAGFAPGASRRMTLLGMMVGATLPAGAPAEGDAVIYASTFGEGPALEQFLDSFPTPSPTWFQTSIHPSAVQQTLIGRSRAAGEFIPLTGARGLTMHAALAALLSPAERVWWCGGEERGTWLTENGAASDRSFGFVLGLTRTRSPASRGRLAMTPVAASGALGLGEWFDRLHLRQNWAGVAGEGWRLELQWL